LVANKVASGPPSGAGGSKRTASRNTSAYKSHTFNARDDRAKLGGRRVQPGPRGRLNQKSRVRHGAPVDALSLAGHPGLERAKHRAGSELASGLLEWSGRSATRLLRGATQTSTPPSGIRSSASVVKHVRVASPAARAAASMPARERLVVRADASRGRLRRRTMDAASSGRRGEDASDSKPGRHAASLSRETAPSRPATPSPVGAPATPRRPSQLDALPGAGCGSPPTCPVGLRRPGVSVVQ
jgi:hypothetical protein